MNKEHQCQLYETEHQDVVKKFIHSGLFIQARRKLKKLVILSPKHPKTRLYFKSEFSIYREQFRQMLFFRNSIHPMSILNFWMQNLIMIGYVLVCLLIPFQLTLRYIDLYSYPTILAFLIVAMLWQTQAGVILKEKIILKRSEIIKTYLKTIWYTEGLTITATIFIISDIYYFRFTWSRKIRPLYFLCFLPRSVFINRTYTVFGQYFRSGELFFTLLKSAILIILLELFLVFLYLAYMNDDWVGGNVYSWDYLVDAFFVTIALATSADKVPSDNISAEFQILVILISSITHFVIFLSIFKQYNTYLTVNSQKIMFMEEFNEFMDYYHFPPTLRYRLLQYFNFKYGFFFYKDRNVISILTTNLKEDVNKILFEKFFKKLFYYDLLPLESLTAMANSLKLEIYLPGDVIVEFGTSSDAMYFISVGQVAVYDENNVEMCHKLEGEYFGEIGMILKIFRTSTVVAITPCRLYKLSSKVLLGQVNEEVFSKLRDACLRELENIIQE